jgi:hypothetical protein
VTITLDIDGELLAATERLAAERRTTVRALVEEGLRLVLDRDRTSEPAPPGPS